MRLRAGVACDVGRVRQTNEDSYLVREGLYAVCDGMGGALGGEIASEMACRGLLSVDPATADAQVLSEAVEEANLAIVARSLGDHGLLGMGTTLTAALVGQNKVSVAHVGDSRAYLWHEGRLTQLTDDHSWVGEMIRRGELTPAEAAVHPHRSVITKALGTDYELEPDLVQVSVEVGDRLLLCSDGLTGMVSDSDIERVLGQDEDPQALAERLVEAALAGGGEDNVTVIVVEVLPPGEEPVVGHSSSGEAEEEGAPSETGILFGPADRGVASASVKGRHRPLRGRRANVSPRERLGDRVAPLLRPAVGSRVRSGKTVGVDGPANTGVLAKVDVSSGLAVPQEGGNSPAIGNSTVVGAVTDSGMPAHVGSEAAPGRTKGWSRRRAVIAAIVVVVVILAAIGGFALFNSTVYYVGAYNGSVALYHGLPGSFLGIELSSAVELGTVSYDSLAPYVKSRIDGHELITKEEGQRFLRSLGAAQ